MTLHDKGILYGLRLLLVVWLFGCQMAFGALAINPQMESFAYEIEQFETGLNNTLFYYNIIGKYLASNPGLYKKLLQASNMSVFKQEFTRIGDSIFKKSFPEWDFFYFGDKKVTIIPDNAQFIAPAPNGLLMYPPGKIRKDLMELIINKDFYYIMYEINIPTLNFVNSETLKKLFKNKIKDYGSVQLINDKIRLTIYPDARDASDMLFKMQEILDLSTNINNSPISSDK